MRQTVRLAMMFGVLAIMGCSNASYVKSEQGKADPAQDRQGIATPHMETEQEVSIEEAFEGNVSVPPEAAGDVSTPKGEGGDGAEPMLGDGFEIVVERNSYKFEPGVLLVEVGDTVTWVNQDERRHLTASVPGSGPTEKLEIFCPKFHPNTECKHTFTVPGKYPYFCFIHKDMLGEVIVLER